MTRNRLIYIMGRFKDWMIHYGRSGRRVKEIMKLELDLHIIPMHRYTEEELFEMKEGELDVKKRMLEIWKQSQNPSM